MVSISPSSFPSCITCTAHFHECSLSSHWHLLSPRGGGGGGGYNQGGGGRGGGFENFGGGNNGGFENHNSGGGGFGKRFNRCDRMLARDLTPLLLAVRTHGVAAFNACHLRQQTPVVARCGRFRSWHTCTTKLAVHSSCGLLCCSLASVCLSVCAAPHESLQSFGRRMDSTSPGFARRCSALLGTAAYSISVLFCGCRPTARRRRQWRRRVLLGAGRDQAVHPQIPRAAVNTGSIGVLLFVCVLPGAIH